LRFGRSAAIVGKGGRAKAGNFYLPRNWPVRQAGYYKLQYCPSVDHIKTKHDHHNGDCNILPR